MNGDEQDLQFVNRAIVCLEIRMGWDGDHEVFREEAITNKSRTKFLLWI